ncbi:hypothetical protein [Georgenia ruanii]|uniref:hypothetical protein n=1 Tax=Georgenia ruanii TaxID=348442 RepID=UPI0012644344|nr:hypothetical protein [Georgenia ruanii]
MRNRPTRLSRSTAVAAAALAVLNLVQAVARGAGASYQALLLGSLGAVGLLAAAKLWKDGCFESRLASAAAAALAFVTAALTVTAGMPGAPPDRGAMPWATAVLALGVLALIVTDATGRRPPYARRHE